MRLAASGRVFQKLSAAVFDQALLSAANFAVGFILIRFTNDRNYGLYVLVQSTLVLLVSAQNAWVTGPLTVLGVNKSPEVRREIIGSIKDSQQSFLRVVALALLVVPAVAYGLRLWDGLSASVVAGAILAGWTGLRREYLRNVLLIYTKAASLLFVDAIYVAVLLGGVVAACFASSAAVIGTTVALTIAAWAGAFAAHRVIAAHPGWATGDAAPAWREMRTLGWWSLVGSMTYWIFAQSYSFILAGKIDLKAVTDVNAARLMLMPIMVISIGMQSLMTPMAAAWNADLGLVRMLKRLFAVFVLIAIIDIVYIGCVWIFRDFLIGSVLRKHIDGSDRLLLLWACVAFIGLMRDVVQCGLFALGRMKSLAGQVALSAVVALTIMWFGIARWGAASVMIGQIAGELVNLVGMIFVLRQHHLRLCRDAGNLPSK